MSERIRRAGQVSWAVVGIAALVVFVGALAWVVRVIWPPLILAGAIVFLLNPIVTFLHRRRIPRVLGVSITYMGFIVLVSGIGLALVPLASDQVDQLADDWPEIRGRVEDWINDLHERSQNWVIEIPSVGEIEQEVGNDNDTIADRIDQVRDIGGRVFHVLLILLLAPILAFYLLIDLPRLRRVTESLIPARSKDEILLVGRRLNRAIGGFFRGQLMVAFLVGLMSSIGMLAIDLPFWLIVGMIAGLFNLIPLIGPWIGAVPGIMIALTTRDVGTAVWVAVIMAAVQQIDNHFISPIVMRRAVRMHPAAVMLALVAGGTLGGFFGLLIAVPTAATLKIVAAHLWRTYVLGEPVDTIRQEWEAADAAPGVGIVRDVGIEAEEAEHDDRADHRHAGVEDDAGEPTSPVEYEPRP